MYTTHDLYSLWEDGKRELLAMGWGLHWGRYRQLKINSKGYSQENAQYPSGDVFREMDVLDLRQLSVKSYLFLFINIPEVYITLLHTIIIQDSLLYFE